MGMCFEVSPYFGSGIFGCEGICWKPPICTLALLSLQLRVCLFSTEYRQEERNAHSVTFLKPGHAFADFLDRACDVFAEDGRILFDKDAQGLDQPVKRAKRY